MAGSARREMKSADLDIEAHIDPRGWPSPSGPAPLPRGRLESRGRVKGKTTHTCSGYLPRAPNPPASYVPLGPKPLFHTNTTRSGLDVERNFSLNFETENKAA